MAAFFFLHLFDGIFFCVFEELFPDGLKTFFLALYDSN